MTVLKSDKEASDAEISILKDALQRSQEAHAADTASHKELHGQAAGCIESLEAQRDAAAADTVERALWGWQWLIHPLLVVSSYSPR